VNFMTRLRAAAVIGLLGLGVAASVAEAQTQPPPPPPPRTQTLPIPKPFPTVDRPATTTPPAETPARPQAEQHDAATGETMVGNAPVYPAAEFVQQFEAGRGQSYYLYGTNLSYQDIVDYYKTRLRTNGREIFKAPAMHQFDLGRFDENTMAYPPSVVVKDYTWNGETGYLVADGTTEKRYRTIIQIVPAGGS
jgi:hypothetical protein